MGPPSLDAEAPFIDLEEENWRRVGRLVWVGSSFTFFPPLELPAGVADPDKFNAPRRGRRILRLGVVSGLGSCLESELATAEPRIGLAGGTAAYFLEEEASPGSDVGSSEPRRRLRPDARP